MPHVPLPPSSDEPEDGLVAAARPTPSLGVRVRPPAEPAGKPKFTLASPPAVPGKPKLAGVVSGNGPVHYIVQVRMAGTTFSGFAFLTHYRQFSQEELDRMIAEAVGITHRARIANRRKDLAAKETRIDDFKQMNEALFKTDLDFFETVMSDKFEFDIVRANVCRAEIEPTAKVY